MVLATAVFALFFESWQRFRISKNWTSPLFAMSSHDGDRRSSHAFRCAGGPALACLPRAREAGAS